MLKYNLFSPDKFHIEKGIIDSNTVLFVVILEDNNNAYPIEIELTLTGVIKVNWGDL